jgi:seryl-tRNA synthetase
MLDPRFVEENLEAVAANCRNRNVPLDTARLSAALKARRERRAHSTTRAGGRTGRNGVKAKSPQADRRSGEEGAHEKVAALEAAVRVADRRDSAGSRT